MVKSCVIQMEIYGCGKCRVIQRQHRTLRSHAIVDRMSFSSVELDDVQLIESSANALR